MKAKISLVLFTVLYYCSMAFAVNGSGFYNLTYQHSGGGFHKQTLELQLRQASTACNTWYNTTCVSVKDTPKNLYNLLDSAMKEAAKKDEASLSIMSDIDLGEYGISTKEGECDVNHKPLPLKAHVAVNGNGKTIKNLCYSAKNMEGPVGLFNRVDSTQISNLKLNGVRIYINGESGDGADYYPVGALAGIVNYSNIDTISIANDSVQAPFAGALIGFVQNSTVQNVTGNDDIFVTNKVKITEGYAGSSVVDAVSDYQVFLGGLAGAAYRSLGEDPSFIKDSIKVEVHDYASGHKSALGGISGLLSTTGETDGNLYVYTKSKTNGTVPSRISGGSSMGGLFGVRMVYVEYHSPVAGDFTLSNSRFEGEISNSSSPSIESNGTSSAVVAVGGLVGLDSSIAQMSVRYLNSVADVTISDSLKDASLYSYYAGGILGYGGACGSSTKKGEDFVSITGVKTTGSITVAASGKAFDGLHSQTYLGGIAGSVCIAQADNMGFVNDTSSVSISSKIKTSLDAKRMANNSPARDEVYIGGMIGFVNVAVAETDVLSGLRYTGSIYVEDSLNNVNIGGVIGGFLQKVGGRSLHFKNISIKNADLITYKAVEAENSVISKQTTKVGGLCGFCNEIAMIEKVGVSGNINVSGAYSGDSILVGGLVGTTYSTNHRFNLKNSFMVGDVLVTATGKSVKTGYLVGAVQSAKFEIQSSYHYSENETVEPFGALNGTEDFSANWKTCDSVHYIIRNGSTKEIAPAQKHQNGTFLAESMKTSSFAGFLNKLYKVDEDDSKNDYVWTYVSGVNDDLPIFADSKNPPVIPEAGTFVVTFIADRDSATIKQESVKEGNAATAPDLEDMPEFEGYTFSGNWNKNYDNIMSDLTVMAIYDINSYVVKFFDFDGSKIGDDRTVEYLGAAEPPTTLPLRTGYKFVGWNDSSYTEVRKDLNVNAVYEPLKFWIAFVDYDGTTIDADSVNYDGTIKSPAIDMKRKSTAEYNYTFVGWAPELSKVTSDAEYVAVYDSAKIKYPVTFWEDSENMIGDTLWVEYGTAAVAPKAPEHEGFVFVGWDSRFEVVKGILDVTAVYEKKQESSSSVESSSSSAEVSSSSETSSSSEESSSSRGELKLVEPKIEQSGNAVRLTFDTENANTETVARVVVTGENGVIVDTVISDDIVKGGTWEMVPAPMGKFTVELTLDDKKQTASFESDFEIASEIEVRAQSWQMVSLSALDSSSMKIDDDISFYWWDEHNPVGDYWQYRAFTGGNTDATRGFWYGTAKGKPLVLQEKTGAKDSEIVWELDSLYSGWNLVANPYGWYVDLSKGAADDGSEVSFWRWDPTESDYKIPTVIGPYEAVWAKAPHALTWRVSAAPVFGITEKTFESAEKGEHPEEPRNKGLMKAGSDLAPGSFVLVATLSDEYGKKDSWNVIGAGKPQTLEEPPAGMGNRVSLAIRDKGENGSKGAKLAKSIKAVDSEYSWTLEMSASTARDGKLSFDGIADLEKQGLKLYVVSDGKMTEITEGKSVDVALAKSASQLEVRVAAPNAVVATKIGGFKSSVAGSTLQLGFDAPESVAGAKSNYVIAGVDGKVVASGHFTATAGSNRLSLKAPKPGIYFVRIKVGRQDMTSKVFVR